MAQSEHTSAFGSGTQAVFTFVQPTEKLKISYREQQARLRRAIARHRDLQKGCLLDTLEKGVPFPVIHVNFRPHVSGVPRVNRQSSLPPTTSAGSGGARRKQRLSSSSSSSTSGAGGGGGSREAPLAVAEEVDYEDDDDDEAIVMAPDPSRMRTRTRSDDKSRYYGGHHRHYSNHRPGSATSSSSTTAGVGAAAKVKLLKSDALGSAVHVQQGLYEEVKRIEPDYSFSGRDNIDQRAFIILGFKTLDTGFSSVLEQTWRDWTGARAIYLKLHNVYDLARIIFYHRVSPVNELDMFMYIVLVECWNVQSKNLIHILDFVQRMRVERLNGYISLYRDLGLEEGDSNYHSGSQESLPVSLAGQASASSSATTRVAEAVIEVGAEAALDDGEDEDDARGKRANASRNNSVNSIIVVESVKSPDKPRLVEQITLETKNAVKFPKIN